MAEETKPTGKIQKGDGKNAVSSLAESKVEAGDKTNRVLVNPALRGPVEVPYFDDDGNLKSETFEEGKTHLVDDDTAALQINGAQAFVEAPAKKKE